MSDGRFVTFPVCWLAVDKPWAELTGTVIGYGFFHYLLVLNEHSEAAVLRSSSKSERCIHEKLRVQGGSLRRWHEDYQQVKNFETKFEAQFGRTFHPSVDLELLFETRDDKGLTEHQMRVHIALLSALGAKPFVRAGWPVLQFRAAGHLRNPGSIVKPLSRGQIERALRILVSRNLWRCYSYGRGHAGVRYWTNKRDVTLEKLVQLVETNKAKQQNRYFAEQQRKAAAIAATFKPAGVFTI